MKKAIYISIYLLFCGINLSAQGIRPCVPTQDGAPAGDEPPGCFLCGPIYVSDMEGFTKGPPTDDLFPCGTIENNQFISFVADAGGLFEGSYSTSNCQQGKGIQLIIFDRSFTPVSHCYRSGDWPGHIVERDLIPGEIYWIMIDGLDGDICDLLLTVSKGFVPQCEYTLTIQPTDASFICPGSTVEMEVDVICDEPIQWKVDSTGSILSGQGTNQVEIKWNTPGTKCIEVQIDSSCFQSMIVKETFEVLDEMPFITVTEMVCPEDILPPKDTTILTNNLGCEYYQIREFEPFISIPKELEIKICTGKTYELPGTNMVFDSTGIYDLVLEGAGQFGCDSLIYLDLEFLPTTVEDLICIPQNNGLRIEWKELPSAHQFQISINDDFLGFTNRNFYEVSILTPDTFYNFEILPIANDSACLFEPLSIGCGPLTSSTNNFSLSENIQLLPNPTSAKVQITSPTSVEWVRVFDISGREILYSTERVRLRREVVIDLSGEAAGVYFFKVKTEKGIVTKRVVLF